MKGQSAEQARPPRVDKGRLPALPHQGPMRNKAQPTPDGASRARTLILFSIARAPACNDHTLDYSFKA